MATESSTGTSRCLALREALAYVCRSSAESGVHEACDMSPMDWLDVISAPPLLLAFELPVVPKAGMLLPEPSASP
eukprot:scaffold16175_cov43-Prasinocladus_malaysianus.AAC.2